MDNVHTLERKPALIKPPPAAEAFYSEVLQLMAKSGIAFLVSGTYALASYTGSWSSPGSGPGRFPKGSPC